MSIDFDPAIVDNPFSLVPTVFVPDPETTEKFNKFCEDACGEWKTVQPRTPKEFLAEIKVMTN